MSFIHMIYTMLHVTRLVYDDEKLVLGSLWTLGECAQVPFSCILVLGGFYFSNSPDLLMSSSCLNEYNEAIAFVLGLINLYGLPFQNQIHRKYEHQNNHFNNSKHQMFPLLQAMVHWKCFLIIIKFGIA